MPGFLVEPKTLRALAGQCRDSGQTARSVIARVALADIARALPGAEAGGAGQALGARWHTVLTGLGGHLAQHADHLEASAAAYEGVDAARGAAQRAAAGAGPW